MGNEDENYFYLNIQDITIILDIEQLSILNKLNKRLIYQSGDEYPYYNRNGKKTNIMNILYNNNKTYTFSFKNGNHFDIRKNNVIIENEINRKNEYNYDNSNNIYSIKFDLVTIIIDPKQYSILHNLNKRLIYNSTNTYPYYNKNYKKYDLLQILYNYKKDNIKYHFKNNNIYDLRVDNVVIYHEYNDYINTHYDIINYIPGHYIDNGKDAYIMKNPIWITKDNDYLLYCEHNIICILCEKSYNLIKEYEKRI